MIMWVMEIMIIWGVCVEVQINPIFGVEMEHN